MSFNPPFGLWLSISELNADYRTGKGEQRSVKLADDVSIDLNTQTSIAIRRSEEQGDRLELIAGEASFATSPRAQRPLVVKAATGLASADSARFDIRRLPGGDGAAVAVTCLTGSVRVDHRSDRAELGPGQQLHYDDGGLGRIATINPETASSWQRGIVVFRATPLAEAIEEINRYRPGRIVLMNPALGQKQISGRFRIDEMNEVLTRLQQAFNARVQTFPGGIVFLS
jgi:transmembrane sensor